MKYTHGKKNPLLYLVTIKNSRHQTKLSVFLPKPALLGLLFSKMVLHSPDQLVLDRGEQGRGTQAA